MTANADPLRDLLSDIDAAELDALEAAKTRWAIEEDHIRTEFEERRRFARDGYGEDR